VGSDAFPQYFALLSAWLLDASGKEPIGEAHPLHDIKANPSGPSHPDVFYLCSSPDSAAFAGQAGVGMVFAEFIARTEARRPWRPTARPSSPRRSATSPGRDRDHRLRGRDHRTGLARGCAAPGGDGVDAVGRRRRFTDPADAQSFLDEWAGTAVLADVESRTIAADPATVAAQLQAKADRHRRRRGLRHGHRPTLAARIRSLELIAQTVISPTR
jgi:alkanesulfonate monooxygenase SsuD/methylene tetrahydromethanopterin reductase-like flavin-dependent oxidoreductase (luciferase family)